ncbi:hypothetical protein [Pseudomonas sp. GOM6]|uniref:hypothetical protein n=1 Tax=Pseudomonas sp. GOM6 TaxID=3036944 RepID=UPI00240979A6|nr:hypothetical protein [Pseudomonas sp. GOM6]MDG1581016.1 hypothetical protein [Pseudomonas sp. GOM6]
MTQKHLSSPLSFAAAIQALGQDIVITGEGVEAEADRLFVARRWAEARDLYATLEIDGPERREKLALSMLSSGQTPSTSLMQAGIDAASAGGLGLHIYCLAYDMRSGSSTPEGLKALMAIYMRAKEVEASRETRIMMIASCAFLAARPHRQSPELVELHLAACADLEALESLHAPSLRILPLLDAYRREVEDQAACDSIRAEIRLLLDQIAIPTSPMLAIPFKAAHVLGDHEIMRSVTETLCTRFAADTFLEPTVSNAAIIYNAPEILELLPVELKQTSLDRPEIRLLLALHQKDSDAVLEAVDYLAEATDYEPLSLAGCVVEPLHNYLLHGEDTYGFGAWSTIYCWQANFSDLLVERLPSGPGRKKHLMSVLTYASNSLTPEVLMELAQLFNDDPSYAIYIELPTEAYEHIAPQTLARFLVETARQSPDEELYFYDEDWAWDRYLSELRHALQSIEPEERAGIEAVIERWGVPVHPTLSQRLAGASLPDSVRNAIAALETSLDSLAPAQLPYLQHCLSRIAGAVPDLVSPAVTSDVSVQAFNDLISPSVLTKVGEDRLRKLAKRYGAAGVLRGIEALMTMPGFDSKADGSIDALSRKLVELQGSLQNRRAYLAAVLRNRLPKLNTHWLDKQVVEAMRRGVDIEQMIDLAKVVTSWDMWSDGIEDLQPY